MTQSTIRTITPPEMAQVQDELRKASQKISEKWGIDLTPPTLMPKSAVSKRQAPGSHIFICSLMFGAALMLALVYYTGHLC